MLVLFRSYPREDVMAALERAVRFHAYSYSSLERILSALGTPKPPWQTGSGRTREVLSKIWDNVSLHWVHVSSSEYQHLLFDQEFADDSEKDRPRTGKR